MKNYIILKITFLGTGTSQGIPVIGSKDEVSLSIDSKDKRLRSSVMVEWESYVYIIDCGPDFRSQMISAEVENISGILFTHFHADHSAGLDDIRPFSHKNGSVAIFAAQNVIENFKERFAYIFTTKNKYMGAPNVIVNVIDDQAFKLGNLQVQPINVMHGKLPIYGYRFNKFAYITDAKSIEDQEISKLVDLDILVINALRIEQHATHFNLREALDFIEVVKPKRAFLTHISHKLGLHEEVSKILPDNVFLAFDGLKISSH